MQCEIPITWEKDKNTFKIILFDSLEMSEVFYTLTVIYTPMNILVCCWRMYGTHAARDTQSPPCSHSTRSPQQGRNSQASDSTAHRGSVGVLW